MSKKGVVRPIRLSRAAAKTVSRFLTDYFIPAASTSSLPAPLVAGIRGFASKLHKAANRRRASADAGSIRLWTLTPAELYAGSRFVIIIWLDRDIPDAPAGDTLGLQNACEDLLVELLRVRGRGRPRLKASHAQALEEKYWGTNSAFRGELIGGSHLRKARERLAGAETVINDQARNNPAQYHSAVADIGRDALRDAAAVVLDAITSQEQLPEFMS